MRICKVVAALLIRVGERATVAPPPLLSGGVGDTMIDDEIFDALIDNLARTELQSVKKS